MYKNSLSSGFMDRKGTHLSVKYPKSMYITKFLRNSLCPILRRTALSIPRPLETVIELTPALPDMMDSADGLLDAE